MKSQTDPRHSARKLALSSIFCWLFTEPHEKECVEVSEELLDLDDVNLELAHSITEGVKKDLSKIDKIIEEAAPEWPLEKISKVDLVILRIAIYELLFGKKTPVKVAIDEAVELAKEFGNDTSHKFINGVLGTVVEEKIEKGKKDAK
jgi:N utilization substance protein B